MGVFIYKIKSGQKLSKLKNGKRAKFIKSSITINYCYVWYDIKSDFRAHPI